MTDEPDIIDRLDAGFANPSEVLTDAKAEIIRLREEVNDLRPFKHEFIKERIHLNEVEHELTRLRERVAELEKEASNG